MDLFQWAQSPQLVHHRDSFGDEFGSADVFAVKDRAFDASARAFSQLLSFHDRIGDANECHSPGRT